MFISMWGFDEILTRFLGNRYLELMTYPRFLSIVSVTLALLWSSVYGSAVSPQVLITANGAYQQVSWPLPDNKTGLVAVQAVGTFGGGSIQFYGSLDDGITYFPVGSAIVASGTQTFNWRDGKLYYTMSGAISPGVTLTFFSATGSPASSGGGGGGGASGSVTSAGTNGTLAQAVQGITGGIPFAVSASALPLPTGAATSSLQTTGNASLTSMDGKIPSLVSGRMPIDGSGVTQPVSAASLPLPSGAATSALQSTINATLGTPMQNSGGSVGANVRDGAGTAITSTLVGSKQRLDVTLAAGGTAGATAPTIIDQVGGSDGTNLRAFSTDTNGRLNVNNISGTVSLPTGAATAALQAPILTTVSGNITTQNLVPAGAATAGSAVELTCSNFGTANVQVTGSYTGVLSMQVTVDGTNWITLANKSFQLLSSGAQADTITSATVGIWKIDVSGAAKIRVTGLAAMTGTAAVTINGVAGVGFPFVNSSLNYIANSSASLSNKGGSGAGTLRVAAAAATHSAASSENVLLTGGFVTSTLDTTLVQGDVAQLAIATGGQLITKEGASAENDWYYAAATGGITNTTTGVTAKAAGAASIRNFVRSATISCDALGAATELVINDGAAGTVMARIKLPITTFVQPFTVQFNPPLRGTAATLIEIKTLTATVTGGVFVNLQGYQGF